MKKDRKTKAKIVETKSSLDEDDEVFLPLDEGDEGNQEQSNASESSDEEDEDAPGSERQAISFLRKTWKGLNLPEKEENIVGRWYGCIYGEGKKQSLYVGKALNRFLFDDDGPTVALQLECLKPNHGLTNILESPPPHLPDVDKFDIHRIIAGPLEVRPLNPFKTLNRWEVPWYQNLKKTFSIITKLDRKKRTTCLLPGARIQPRFLVVTFCIPSYFYLVIYKCLR